MANLIEIRVRATDDTKATYDAAKAKALEAGTAAGETYASAYARASQDYQPLTASRVTGPRTMSFGPTPEEIQEQKAQIESLRREMEQGVEDEVDSGLEDVLDPSGPVGTKLRDDAKKTGEQAGKEMGEGMSPLIATALVGAAAVGAPLLLAGMGAAFVGVTALALKSNKVIANDYQQLGKEASSALTSAAAPAAGTLHQALLGMEGTVQQLTPELKGLFVNAEPDITAVASGVDAFASGILPGMSSALKSSQVVVSDFGASMGPLGQNVGGFFQGLTRDANTTGEGMESLLGTAGHLVNTLGGALGSAASVGSTALMGLDPVINTTLSLVQKVDNAGTVGAGAGLFAAFKLDPSISAGLGKAAVGMAGLSEKLGTGTVMGERFSGAALSTASALEKGASVMSGPWGLAIGAGVGLATGLVGALINAAHASDALTLSQQGLDQAVSKDNGTAGQATAAFVAAQAQADGLAKSASGAGVSLDTWTEAVLGNKAAQDQVTSAVEKLNQSQLKQQVSTDQTTTGVGKEANAMEMAATANDRVKESTNQLTDKNTQMIASMKAQAAQTAAAVAQQKAYQDALAHVADSQTVFVSALSAGHAGMVADAQQSALNVVSSLNLGDSTYTLGSKLYGVLSAYNQATTGAQGYATVLQGLNGTTENMDQAQVTLAQQMLNAKTSFAQNKFSLDLSTQAGINNRQSLNQASTAIQAMGDAQYQATGDINKGNATIQQQITAFVNATGATGKARTAIIAYLEQITKIPPNVSTTLHVNTGNVSTAISQVKGLQNMMAGVGGAGGTEVSASELEHMMGHAYGGNIGAAAVGGAQGGLTLVGENGPELANLPYGSSVMPNANFNSLMGGMGGGALRIQLDVTGTGGGSGLEQLFISWLKGAIRARGGGGTTSVQRALGQVV